MTVPLLRVEGLHKRYTRGWPARQVTFAMEADFEIEGPGVVGVMGARPESKLGQLAKMRGLLK